MASLSHPRDESTTQQMEKPPTTTGQHQGQVAADDGPDEYPGPKQFLLIVLAIALCTFLIGLDKAIIAPIIPSITDDFHSLGDIGWYTSSFLIAICVFQPLYGKLLSFRHPKWILLVCIAVLEIGSILSAAAPSSVVFIIGRVIGVQAGAVNILVISAPLAKRAAYQGVFPAIMGISSILAPLIGGALATHATWRWAFWINLPIGGAVALTLLILVPGKSKPTSVGLLEQIKKLDPLGTAIFIPTVVCLLLALQWGGTQYRWDNWRIILLFVLFGVLALLFGYYQYRAGDRAMLPLRILRQRSVAAAMAYVFFSFGAMLIIFYWLSLYFQAVRGTTALRAGIDSLPIVIAMIVTSNASGILTRKTGYYIPQLFAAVILSAVGVGLISTLRPHSSPGLYIGFQILYGAGIGLGVLQPNIAVQACLRRTDGGSQGKGDIPIALSMLLFMQTLGGAFWLSIAQVIFTSSLARHLRAVPGLQEPIDARSISNLGATELRSLFPPAEMDAALSAYNKAVVDAFRLALGCVCATVLGAAAMEWKNVKTCEAQDGNGKNGKGDIERAEGGGSMDEHAQAKVDAQTDDDQASTDSARHGHDEKMETK